MCLFIATMHACYCGGWASFELLDFDFFCGKHFYGYEKERASLVRRHQARLEHMPC